MDYADAADRTTPFSEVYVRNYQNCFSWNVDLQVSSSTRAYLFVFL